MITAGLVPLLKLLSADKGSGWVEDIAALGFFGGAGILTASSFAPRNSSSSLLSGENIDGRLSGFVTMFAMGLLYGFFYWRWRQLWPLIVAHALQMLYSLLTQSLTG